MEITNPEPFTIVIEKTTTITVVEDNEIRLFIANEDIQPYQPVFINNDDTVSVASGDVIESWNRFLGINTALVTQGQQARVKIMGTLYDDNFNWDLFQQVANVLSPKLVLITHHEPTLL